MKWVVGIVWALTAFEFLRRAVGATNADPTSALLLLIALILIDKESHQ